MITLTLENVNVALQELPDGAGVLAFSDPASEIQVQIPMTARQRNLMEMMLAGKQLVVPA